MATFPNIEPSFSVKKEQSPLTRVVQYADGFEQRLVRGLAANKRCHIVNLNFNVSQTDADTINTLLNSRFDDQEAFDVTIAGESSSRKFKCTQRSSSFPYNNRVTINLTLKEVFEP